MVRNRSGRILVVDNDVLVYIFHNLYNNQSLITRIVGYLSLTYGRIWIPGEVKNEFLIKRRDKKRNKIINRIFERHATISECPLRVARHEIDLLVGMQEENRGEADAIIQGQKAKQKSDLFFEDIVFLSNDEEALLMARNHSLSTLPYSEFKLSLRDVGITLP